MSEEEENTAPNKAFWAIGYTALVWNIIGIVSYLMTVTLSPEALDLMPLEERALYTEVPLLINGAYAIAVFGSTIACLLLLLRRSLSVVAFMVSLVAIIIQMGYGIFFSPLLEVQGPSALALPLSVVAVAAFLTWYAISVKQRAWYK